MISFPHMGNIWVAVKGFFETLGCPVLVPPRTSKRTIELGVRYSPETVCFPFKVTLGNMIEALEQGATTIVMISGRYGLCRLAYYANIQEQILKQLGYKFEMLALKINKEELLYFNRRLKELAGNPKDYYLRFIKAFLILTEKLKLIEEVEQLARKNMVYEINLGETSKITKQALSLLDKAKSFKEIKRAKKEIYKLFNDIKKDTGRDVLRIGILGEFFVGLEPIVNHYIEEKLAQLGVLVSHQMSGYQLFKAGLKLNFKRNYIAKVAKEYLPISSGGEDQQTIGKTLLYAKDGFDGVILLYPFQCMPENNALAILPEISKKYDLPFISFAIDEKLSDGAMQTRIEAFVDLLRMKKYANRNTTSTVTL